MTKQRLLDEIASYADLAAGWDGVGSVAIAPAALADASAFIEALGEIPSGLDAGPSADGVVNLFSDDEGGDGANILFGGYGRIAYWARCNGVVARGVVPFSAASPTIPPDLTGVLGAMPT